MERSASNDEGNVRIQRKGYAPIRRSSVPCARMVGHCQDRAPTSPPSTGHSATAPSVLHRTIRIGPGFGTEVGGRASGDLHGDLSKPRVRASAGTTPSIAANRVELAHYLKGTAMPIMTRLPPSTTESAVPRSAQPAIESGRSIGPLPRHSGATGGAQGPRPSRAGQ